MQLVIQELRIVPYSQKETDKPAAKATEKISIHQRKWIDIEPSQEYMPKDAQSFPVSKKKDLIAQARIKKFLEQKMEQQKSGDRRRISNQFFKLSPYSDVVIRETTLWIHLGGGGGGVCVCGRRGKGAGGGKFWPKGAHFGPNLGECWPIGADFRPILEVGAIFAHCGPTVARFWGGE